MTEESRAILDKEEHLIISLTCKKIRVSLMCKNTKTIIRLRLGDFRGISTWTSSR